MSMQQDIHILGYILKRRGKKEEVEVREDEVESVAENNLSLK